MQWRKNHGKKSLGGNSPKMQNRKPNHFKNSPRRQKTGLGCKTLRKNLVDVSKDVSKRLLTQIFL